MTNNSKTMFAFIYKTYKERQKTLGSCTAANMFDNNIFSSDNILSSWSNADIEHALCELKNESIIKRNIIGDFWLTDNAISKMESQMKDTLNEILDIISKVF